MVVPNRAVIGICCIAEWIVWLLSLGKRRPDDFLRQKLEHVYRTRTMNVEKAKEMLGWFPPVPIDKEIEMRCAKKMGKTKRDDLGRVFCSLQEATPLNLDLSFSCRLEAVNTTFISLCVLKGSSRALGEKLCKL